MKLIGVLVSVQTVLVLLLFMKIDSYESRITQPAQSSEQTDTSAPLLITSPREVSVVDNSSLTSGQLRRIIREELNAISLNNELMLASSGSAQETPIFDDVEMQYRRELVVDKFELLKGQGEVSTGEIENLMGEIARLDPERRTAMMKILNEAMNRGEIKGRF